MKFLKSLLKTRKHEASRASGNIQSVEDYGRDQLTKLAEKGLGFQLIAL